MFPFDAYLLILLLLLHLFMVTIPFLVVELYGMASNLGLQLVPGLCWEISTPLFLKMTNIMVKRSLPTKSLISKHAVQSLGFPI
jgi:hypothetical protein